MVARPFRSSLIVMTLVAVPGYIRQEQAINEAHRSATASAKAAADAKKAADTATATAAALAQLVVRVEQDRSDRRQELCQRDVADRVDDRAMWEAAFILFEGAPEVVELRATLDDRLPLLECDADGTPHPQD